MGKAYSDESRSQVKLLLEQDVPEDEIEKQTGVSDRTIRRWKLELERYGRIGKPPESRTGRHRVMNKDVEQALFDHVAQRPDLSVDDMLWWLYDRFKLVVGTRTIRRAFERRNTSHKKFRNDARKELGGSMPREDDSMELPTVPAPPEPSAVSHAQLQMAPSSHTYQSPYAPVPAMTTDNTVSADISPELARALGGLTQGGGDNTNIHPDLVGSSKAELSEDEETLQLQLAQIALQKREVELKLKMRRLQRARRASQTPRLSMDPHEQSFLVDMQVTPSASASDAAHAPRPIGEGHQGPLTPVARPRDSRSKNKIEEAKKRTEERQERMLKELERRSRRREHLTAEWVQSRDVWAKGPEKLLTQLMHQHQTYAYNQNSLETFEAIFNELYQLVDHTDWYPPVHDDLLRERTRRKMSQLRSKMVKSGEIVSRGDGYAGWTKADGHIPSSVDADPTGGDSLDLDGHQGLQDMGDLPLDMTLGDEGSGGGGGGGRDAMMQNAGDHQSLMHASHQGLQHAHHHAFGGPGLQSQQQQQQQQQQHTDYAQMARQHEMGMGGGQGGLSM